MKQINRWKKEQKDYEKEHEYAQGERKEILEHQIKAIKNMIARRTYQIIYKLTK